MRAFAPWLRAEMPPSRTALARRRKRATFGEVVVETQRLPVVRPRALAPETRRNVASTATAASTIKRPAVPLVAAVARDIGVRIAALPLELHDLTAHASDGVAELLKLCVGS